MPLSKAELNKIKMALEAEKKRLTEENHKIEKRFSSANDSQSRSEMTDFDTEHPADFGSETFEREKDFALSENIAFLMMKVERAIEKIDEGTYGLCDRCGGRISDERLEALPSASLCVKCQDAVERS